ncbi:MAG TPA: cyclase family protein [Flavobacterium sp.]|nr:cyclase family protein [Flavobacterium sp.]
MDKKFKMLDLTHPVSPEIPSWNGESGFEISIKLDYQNCTQPDLFRIQKIESNAGIGTHIDAPAHVIPGGRTVDQLTIEELFAACVVIDVRSEAGEDYIITPDVIEKFEERNGEIKPKSFVIFYTGWDKYWSEREKYHNNHRFPSIDPKVAEILLKRDIAGLGTDTLSPDTGAAGFPVHRAMLGANKFIVENIANAKLLPSTGSKILALPMNITGGTEAPIRLIGFLS